MLLWRHRVGAIFVGVEMVLHLVVHPVIGQVERGGGLLAWSVKLEVVIDLNVRSPE